MARIPDREFRNNARRHLIRDGGTFEVASVEANEAAIKMAKTPFREISDSELTGWPNSTRLRPDRPAVERQPRRRPRSQPPRSFSGVGEFDSYQSREVSVFRTARNSHDTMQLLGLIKLDNFKRKHADARGPLDAWRSEAERAHWVGPQDIKARYPIASVLADNTVVFNIKGNPYRSVIKAKYQNGLILIEWVGTHAEYDKQRF